ncbi:type II toxin-antitoxin system VapC family toxin [Larkinella punicea]|uniref:Type II toxin-antitoxin system VapC family toxin n=1 Tax=Larkinella punicea TaxID=2315727 RepID=A0A368JMI5_9BACT|nr:type II toxin-antitoxin system VapC family toxin [Larkinella punicea]RCR68712.1 type II toxin-antitoxin system VapC family toxin [Larkinella punicea]
MKYLLDTHILIWALTDNPKLNSAVKAILTDDTNELFFSTESIREIILKAKIGKLALPIGIDNLLYELQNEYGIRQLTLKPNHLKQLYLLETPSYHKDPFDHLLICQAIADKLIMISADRNFPYYQTQGLQLLVNTI